MYPEEVKVFIDGKDVTVWLFGEEFISPTVVKNSWTNIDITPYVKQLGNHVIEIRCAAGVGRAEVLVEIS